MIDRAGQVWIRRGTVVLVLSTRPGLISDVLSDHQDDGREVLPGFYKHWVVDLVGDDVDEEGENQKFPWETRSGYERVL